MLLLLLPVLPIYRDAQSMPAMARWIGHFHPVLLHLPIGIFILILLQEVGASIKGRKPEPEVGFPLILGVWSSVAAVIAGYLLLKHGDGSYGDIGERHMWGGTVFTCTVIATAVLKKWVGVMGWKPMAYKLPLVASVGIMGFTSHDGGSMTHGSDFLTKEAPDPVKKMLGIEVESKDQGPVSDPEFYTAVIQPIFERRCVACHKEGKSKGRLRMDTFAMLMKGGKDGPALVPGDSSASYIIERIELPLDEDEHMPPEGKPQVEPNELLVLKWWIDQGADAELRIADAEMPEEISMIVSELVDLPDPKEEKEKAKPKGGVKPDKALVEAVARINEMYPGTLSFESQQSAGVVLSAVSLRGKLGDDEFVDFEPVIPHLVSADLSATSIGDSSVVKLKDASKLRMLRLGQTKVTNNSAKVFTALSELESLNLYGTEVTDVVLAELATLPKLKKLYLWQTGVTKEGVEKFKTAMPECEVVLGVE
ncbi:MAG: c-type cytochrome domain-containing protein [Akkermansiaceae bacterium]|nr:c-type cytochrome domain-containing protein [Akkermansiaceae bacterium]